MLKPMCALGIAAAVVITALAAERTVLDSVFAEGLPATRAALAQLADSLEQARPTAPAMASSAARSA